MPDSGPIRWTPSPVLPKAPMSFADVGYEEMLSRARALKPVLAQRAEDCERLRRLPDETERDLHTTILEIEVERHERRRRRLHRQEL